MNWLVFLPLLIFILGSFNRKPAALVMVVSSVTAMLIGIGVHGFSAYNAILSAISGFNVEMIETVANTPSNMLESLLNRGGINSMSTTLIIIIAAFLLAAGMDVSGALEIGRASGRERVEQR